MFSQRWHGLTAVFVGFVCLRKRMWVAFFLCLPSYCAGDDPTCLPYSVLLCDGEWDCPFGEDEANCPSCGPRSFLCRVNTRTTCLSDSVFCDGVDDCDAQADEFQPECNDYVPEVECHRLYITTTTTTVSNILPPSLKIDQ